MSPWTIFIGSKAVRRKGKIKSKRVSKLSYSFSQQPLSNFVETCTDVYIYYLVISPSSVSLFISAAISSGVFFCLPTRPAVSCSRWAFSLASFSSLLLIPYCENRKENGWINFRCRTTLVVIKMSWFIFKNSEMKNPLGKFCITKH